MTCALQRRWIRCLASTTRTWRSPAAGCRKTSRACTSQRMPGLSLVCARFSAATSSHPTRRTVATPSLFSTTASGSATSAAILTSSGELWKSITPPTPSSESCRAASHSMTSPASAMSTCRAVSCAVLPTFPTWLTYRGSSSGPTSHSPPPTQRSSPSCASLRKKHPARFPDRWHLALQPIIVPYQQETGPHPDASSGRRCAFAHHRLRQLLDPSAGPRPLAPA